MYDRECLETLRNLVDLRDVLINFGGLASNSIHDNGDEIRCPCPLHGGDNPTAFSWKRSTGHWSCFTKGCGANSSHDLYGFIGLKLNLPFTGAVKLIASTYNFDLTNITSSTSRVFDVSAAVRQDNKIKKYEYEKQKELDHLPGCVPNEFPKVLSYLESRGYRYEDVSLFNYYPSKDSMGFLRLGIPVYDVDGALVGVNARLMDTIIDYPETVALSDGRNYVIPKYRMTEFKKGSVLYNLNNAKTISHKQGLIIVEGQLDVARLYTYGITNSVCTMGTQLTPQQVALLYKYCYHVTFLVEEGEAASAGVTKSIKGLSSGMKISIARLEKGDADSNRKEVIIEALKNSILLSSEELQGITKGELKI